MSKSRDNEFGDKNSLETGPKWAQFGPNYSFGCYKHQHQLDTIVFKYNMQNQQNLMRQSREIDQKQLFGDKKVNNLGKKIFFKNRASSLFNTH